MIGSFKYTPKAATTPDGWNFTISLFKIKFPARRSPETPCLVHIPA